MTILRFPYQPAPLLGAPPVSVTSGAGVRLRPYVPTRIIGASGSRRFSRALVDSGSYDTIFPLDVAQMIGLTSFKQPRGATHTRIKWRGQSYVVDFADVDLELNDGATTIRWPATVGF